MYRFDICGNFQSRTVDAITSPNVTLIGSSFSKIAPSSVINRRTGRNPFKLRNSFHLIKRSEKTLQKLTCNNDELLLQLKKIEKLYETAIANNIDKLQYT